MEPFFQVGEPNEKGSVMKILYLSLDPRQPFNGRTGGATHMREMVSALRREGCDVKVVAVGAKEFLEFPGEPMRGSRVKDGMKKLIPRSLWLLARDLNDIRLDRKTEPLIEQAVEKFSPDIIYERNAYLFASGARIAVRKGVPYFVEINSPTAEERKKNFGAPLAGWHIRVEKFQHKVARGIVVVSDEMKRRLVSWGVDSKKIKVIPNGVNLERFAAPNRREDIREKYGLSGTVIGFVGSIASYHGVNVLLDEMERIVKAEPNAKALIVGGGPLLDEMLDKAKKSGLENVIVFTGEVPPDEVPFYISAMDICVLPRFNDYGSPIKVFEYGALALPVVSIDVGPVRAIIRNNKEGLLVRDSDSLAEAVIRLIKNPQDAKRMGENLKKRIENNFTWSHSAKRLLAFVEERLK